MTANRRPDRDENGVDPQEAHPDIKPLKIVIIGAGIGGLSAAIALRRVGHDVTLHEQSRLAGEIGAAVHLAPNSNGIIRRWGLRAENFGANSMNRIKEIHQSGRIIKDIDLTYANTLWQHPWQLVHRASLHSALRTLATEETDEYGPPAKLHTSSRVVNIDPAKGAITLADESVIQADVLIGADGVYSRCRDAVMPNSPKPFSSGKAAFRFLIPTQLAREDPETMHIEAKDTMCMWNGDDRRIVMYPCNQNEMLNFVCIHPDSESHADANDEWNKTASLEHTLHVFRDFEPALLQLIRKADPAVVKVWQLLDMEKMPSWTTGKLVLIGDAAHPFTPYQGQGAGQAIEDSVALATVLPMGTTLEQISERLRLYQEIRADRAHKIQDYSRQAGRNCIEGKPQIDMMAYTSFNFGHDEYDHATNVFRRWLWAREGEVSWRMPMPLWPSLASNLDCPPHGKFVTAEVRFRTSRTYLETLFPAAGFKFRAAPTVCQASFTVTTLSDLPWLASGSYSRFGLYIHGVQYIKKNGNTITRTYLPVVLDNLADTYTPGRTDVGAPRLFCELDIAAGAISYQVKGSWTGKTLFEMVLNDLEQGKLCDNGVGSNTVEDDILTYRHVPAVGKPGVDAEYPVHISAGQDIKVTKVRRTKRASIKFNAGDQKCLTSLLHVATVMAQVPIFSIESAQVTEGYGDPMGECHRIE